MARGRYQRLPRRRAAANPQPHLEQRGVLEVFETRRRAHRRLVAGGDDMAEAISGKSQGLSALGALNLRYQGSAAATAAAGLF
jgi:hypothetical protein